MADPTQQGASAVEQTLDNDSADDQNSTPLSPREEAIANIDAQRQAQIDAEMQASGAEPDPIGEDGAIVQPMHADGEDPEATAGDLEVRDPETQQVPPALEDFVELAEDGTPLMRIKVDGVEELVPLTQVQTNLQKGSAADERFRENAEWAESLTRRERELDARLAAAEANSLPPTGEDDQSRMTAEEAREKAQSVVDDLLHGDADKAVETLATVFESDGVSSQTSEDPELVAKVAAQTRAQIRAEERQAAMKEGLATFQKEFPQIVEDRDLWTLADAKTNDIAQENPDWTPTQVMREAGRVIMEKFGQGGSDDDSTLNPVNDRQARKDDLVPMPNKATATESPPEPERQQTPQEAVDEIRRQRGQL